MEYKLLVMGNLKLIILLFLSCFLCGQNTTKVIEITQKDSVVLTKDSKNKFFLKIFYKKNIAFNKKNKLKPKVYAGGYSFCEKCKKENDVYILEKQARIPQKSVKYNLNNFLKNNKNIEYFDFENFWNNYFKIENTYYKLVNRGPIN
ncbi:hypothetical protein [Chryseobacterium gambrini]|uniref:hypothetical protein n=1 Tax=Chryseobacterium gambrini TaxID=373672 RepID=UPI003BABEAA1